MKQIFQNVQNKTPLVHCITNYVTVNDCANILLACGGSPIMADDAAEAAEITSICAATVINIGTLNSRTVESMLLAGKRANELGHPVILDPVGAGASVLRTQTAERLLREVKFSAIRGNISEIKTIAGGAGTTKGVDADEADALTGDTLADGIALAERLSAETGAVIAITGAVDIVCGGEEAYLIRNGCPEMSRITGTGCMLSAMTGAYLAANDPAQHTKAAAFATALMGYAGELAYARAKEIGAGTGSMRTYIIDAVSNMTEEKLSGGMKIETVR